MWIQTASSLQHPRQSRARPSGAPGAPAMRISHPTIPPRGWPERPLGCPLLPLRIGLGARCGRTAAWHPPPHNGLEDPEAAGAGVAAPHFCPAFHLFVPLTPPPSCLRKRTPFLIPEPWGWDGRTPSPCSEGFKNYLNEFLPRRAPPPLAGARRASPQVPPGERGWTRSHLGPRLTCGRGRRGPSSCSPPRRGPPDGRQPGPAAHGRGGGRGWLPTPALPRPGRQGRSVGTARRAHLAGSHPSARRGARWERGPGRRGLAALTRRAAEAPARRRSASRPSRARRASHSGDEEPFAHPAHSAAAAGRLHCLTTTRAGFSPRPVTPRDTSVWKIRAPSSRPEKAAGVIRVWGAFTRKDWRTWTRGACFLRGLLSDAQEAECHSDSARGGPRGPRAAHSVSPSATRGAVQSFSYK